MPRQETTPKVSRSPIADMFKEWFADKGEGLFTRTFAQMGIAEEEIHEAKKRYPRKQKSVNAAFVKLRAGGLSSYSPGVYRAHCKELLHRAAHGMDMALGTHAECLAALSEASLKAPLDATHTRVMEVCFEYCFPERPLDWAPTRPAYDGADVEVLETLRRRIGSRSGR